MDPHQLVGCYCLVQEKGVSIGVRTASPLDSIKLVVVTGVSGSIPHQAGSKRLREEVLNGAGMGSSAGQQCRFAFLVPEAVPWCVLDCVARWAAIQAPQPTSDRNGVATDLHSDHLESVDLLGSDDGGPDAIPGSRCSPRRCGNDAFAPIQVRDVRTGWGRAAASHTVTLLCPLDLAALEVPVVASSVRFGDSVSARSVVAVVVPRSHPTFAPPRQDESPIPMPSLLFAPKSPSSNWAAYASPCVVARSAYDTEEEFAGSHGDGERDGTLRQLLCSVVDAMLLQQRAPVMSDYAGHTSSHPWEAALWDQSTARRDLTLTAVCGSHRTGGLTAPFMRGGAAPSSDAASQLIRFNLHVPGEAEQAVWRRTMGVVVQQVTDYTKGAIQVSLGSEVGADPYNGAEGRLVVDAITQGTGGHSDSKPPHRPAALAKLLLEATRFEEAVFAAVRCGGEGSSVGGGKVVISVCIGGTSKEVEDASTVTIGHLQRLLAPPPPSSGLTTAFLVPCTTDELQRNRDGWRTPTEVLGFLPASVLLDYPHILPLDSSGANDSEGGLSRAARQLIDGFVKTSHVQDSEVTTSLSSSQVGTAFSSSEEDEDEAVRPPPGSSKGPPSITDGKKLGLKPQPPKWRMPAAVAAAVATSFLFVESCCELSEPKIRWLGALKGSFIARVERGIRGRPQRWHPIECPLLYPSPTSIISQALFPYHAEHPSNCIGKHAVGDQGEGMIYSPVPREVKQPPSHFAALSSGRVLVVVKSCLTERGYSDLQTLFHPLGVIDGRRLLVDRLPLWESRGGVLVVSLRGLMEASSPHHPVQSELWEVALGTALDDDDTFPRRASLGPENHWRSVLVKLLMLCDGLIVVSPLAHIVVGAFLGAFPTSSQVPTMSILNEQEWRVVHAFKNHHRNRFASSSPSTAFVPAPTNGLTLCSTVWSAADALTVATVFQHFDAQERAATGADDGCRGDGFGPDLLDLGGRSPSSNIWNALNAPATTRYFNNQRVQLLSMIGDVGAGSAVSAEERFEMKGLLESAFLGRVHR